MVTLDLVFGTAGRINTQEFRIRKSTPMLTRKIGKLIGGSSVVAAYADPVWDMTIELGPLLPSQGALVRSSVNTRAVMEITNTNADRPDADVWIGVPITIDIIDCKQKRLGRDITRGEIYTLSIQFPESRIGVS